MQSGSDFNSDKHVLITCMCEILPFLHPLQALYWTLMAMYREKNSPLSIVLVNPAPIPPLPLPTMALRGACTASMAESLEGLWGSAHALPATLGMVDLTAQPVLQATVEITALLISANPLQFLPTMDQMETSSASTAEK